MNIFYDCEFLENGKTIRPISIGMITEDGQKLYRVVRDLRVMQAAYDHPWLRDNVVKHLPVMVNSSGKVQWDKNHPDYHAVAPKKFIARDIRAFVTHYANPKLWAYFAAYDHVVLSQFFGRMIDLPVGMPMWSHDLMQLMEQFPYAQIPNQAGGLHNALSDAEWNKKVYEYLQALSRAQSSR